MLSLNVVALFYFNVFKRGLVAINVLTYSVPIKTNTPRRINLNFSLVGSAVKYDSLRDLLLCALVLIIHRKSCFTLESCHVNNWIVKTTDMHETQIIT